MKTISRAVILCATITAMNAYADEPMMQPASVKKYSMINTHAPEKIKEVCLNQPSCTLCDNIEKILWCAQKLAKLNQGGASNTRNLTQKKEEAFCHQYCFSWIEGGLLKQVTSIINEIASRAELNNDEAFALLTQFNNTLQSIEQKAQNRPHED